MIEKLPILKNLALVDDGVLTSLSAASPDGVLDLARVRDQYFPFLDGVLAAGSGLVADHGGKLRAILLALMFRSKSLTFV